MFGSYNGLFQQLEDNAGSTAAQINTYGKKFALQIDNPKAGTYAPYNHVHKKTDLDYLRLHQAIWKERLHDRQHALIPMPIPTSDL